MAMHIRSVAGSGRRSVVSQKRAALLPDRESLLRRKPGFLARLASLKEKRAASLRRKTHETARGTCIGGGMPDRDSLKTVGLLGLI